MEPEIEDQKQAIEDILEKIDFLIDTEFQTNKLKKIRGMFEKINDELEKELNLDIEAEEEELY